MNLGIRPPTSGKTVKDKWRAIKLPLQQLTGTHLLKINIVSRHYYQNAHKMGKILHMYLTIAERREVRGGREGIKLFHSVE